MWRSITLAAALIAGSGAGTAAPSGGCQLGRGDRLWVEQAVRNWQYAERHLLQLQPAALPEIVAVDARCQVNALPDRGQSLRWKGRVHGGTVRFPDGGSALVGVMSFAGSNPKGPRSAFFVMSAPSVWRVGGVTSELGLETLMDGVLLHEMMHTRQAYFANPTLDALTRQYNLPPDLNDDSLQEKFEKNPAYVADYLRETALLYAAAAAPTDVEARRLAGQALAAMRARRAKWFTGADVQWTPLDDIFLQMEGLGQWLIWKWYVDGPRKTYAPDVAVRAVRRGKKQWTQDEGLGLMLTVDRLVPDWRARAFAAQPALAEELLTMAAR